MNAPSPAGESYDRKVLRTFLDAEGRIKQFPARRKKLRVVLGYVSQSFEPGVRYSEKKVKEILARFNPDTARLRRALVDFGFMEREGGGGDYWRTEGPSGALNLQQGQ
jgi:hypothetical protein